MTTTPIDSIKTETDSTSFTRRVNSTKVKTSEDAPDEPLVYGARDTQWYEHKKKLMHLYGDAYVDYDGKKLRAGYIKLNIEKNVAEAKFIEDAYGDKTQRPTFNDGTKDILYNHLKYNFNTKRGIVYDMVSTEGDLFLHGATTKFVGANEDNNDDVIYNKNTLITTCNKDHPHFGFRARKLKLIPDKIAVIGPANLELGGVPTPLWIPYGFFPLVSGKSTGFIFPQDYEYSPNFGFGLRNFGWYFPISDYLDLKVYADLYTRGTHGLRLHSDYVRRYKYNGKFRIGYQNQIVEIPETGARVSDPSFSFFMEHRQDSKAHPYRTLSGDITIETGNYGLTRFNDAQVVTENTYYSNFNFGHAMPNSPWRFQLGLMHDQNTRSREMNITLPNMSLLMDRIFPFKRKEKGGNEEKWFEKITYKYDVRLKNLIETTDSTLFTNETFQNMKSGISHDMETGTNFKVLKYLTLSTRLTYDEIWMLQEVENTEDSELVLDYLDVDPISGDTNEVLRDSFFITEQTLRNFNTFRTYNARADLNTQIYGTKTFAKGWLRGVRHTIKPFIGYEIAPDTRSIYTQTLESNDPEREDDFTYSRFPRQPFSPSLTNARRSINYGMTHLLEFKYFSKKDSIEKKFKLFDRITMNGNRNFILDSLEWSVVNMGSQSNFFKGATSIIMTLNMDPYMEDGTTRINKTVWSERKKLLRRDYFKFQLRNKLSMKQIIDLVEKRKKNKVRPTEKEPDDEPPPLGDNAARSGRNTLPDNSSRNNKKKGYQDVSVLSWLEKIKFSHDFIYETRTISNIDTSAISTNSLSLEGSIPLTDNWNFTIGRVGYDFVRKGLSYPTFRMSRELHCWKMQFSWHPFRDTYSFSIGVVSSSMNFLEYNYGQNNVDGLLGRAGGYF